MSSNRVTARLKVACAWMPVAAVLVLGTPAAAQSQLPDDDDMQSIWAKLCGETQDPGDSTNKVDICTTQFEILNRDGNPVMVGAITKVEGQEQELLSVTVPQGPQGIAIRTGVRVRIDDGEAIPLRYTFCFAHGCMAEVPATDDLIARLKKGGNVVIALVDAGGNVLSLPVPLQGFAMAYDGEAVDSERYVELRRRMIDEYRRARAESKESDQP